MKRLALTGLLCASLSSGGAAAAEYEMRLGHANDADAEASLFHAYALQLEDLVEQYTDNRVDVVIFPAMQLGGEQEMVRGTQLGTQEAAIASMSNISVFARPLGFFVMPYVFETIDEARYVIDEQWDQMNEWAVEEAGVRLLSVLDAGFRNLTNSRREVTSLEDLEGLKIRVPNNPIMVDTFESFGIDPVPMAWSEVFNALQQGVIDGQENPYDVLLSVKFHEVQDYVTDSQHFFQAAGVIFSDQWFQTLPEPSSAPGRTPCGGIAAITNPTSAPRSGCSRTSTASSFRASPRISRNGPNAAGRSGPISTISSATAMPNAAKQS